MGRAGLVTPLNNIKDTSNVAMLTDLSDCIGCKACEVACKEWNQNKAEIHGMVPGHGYQSHENISASTWTLIKFIEREPAAGKVEPFWSFAKHNCMHCSDAACEMACPVGALQYSSMGAVTLNKETCIGCSYCEQVCPFDAVHVDRQFLTDTDKKAGKCTLCYDRISNGLMPACVQTCPTDCIKYGKREDLIQWAQGRVEKLKMRGYANAQLYGDKELGGLHQLYILLDKPEVYGLPVDPRVSPRVRFWSKVVRPAGRFILGAGLFALIIHWLITRRTLAKSHAKEA